jgi:two-component system alkaline phosphatase synthesis response regulator PhoP
VSTLPPRVLVVEDDVAIRSLLVAALRREPFQVDTAPDGASALQMTGAFEYAVIVLDLMMPRLNGFEFLDLFHATTPAPRSVVLVVTAFDDVKLAKLPAGRVHGIIRKPFDVMQLVTIIREVAASWHEQFTSAAVEPLPHGLDADDHASPAEPTN